jgi:CheY-like chemotaxis protein
MMARTINILVVEDNKYYNNLILETLKQSADFRMARSNFRLKILSFTSAQECIHEIRSGNCIKEDTIAFIDYYLGNGINGTHIVKMLKSRPYNTTVVMLSQSGEIRAKVIPGWCDYFIVKDSYAPALCSLCLNQYLDNKLPASLV